MSSQPPPPPPPGDPGVPPPPGGPLGPGSAAGAEVGTRAGARLVDHIIIGLVNVFIVASVVAAIMVSSGDVGVFDANMSGAGFLTSVLGLVILLGYFVGMEVTTGATLGKRLLNEKVVGPDGGNPDVAQSFKRNAWMLVGLLPGLWGGLLQLAAAGYILYTISNSPTNTGWHDEFSGTRVVSTK